MILKKLLKIEKNIKGTKYSVYKINDLRDGYYNGNYR